MLFETSYKEGFDNYVRVFDETTKKSKSHTFNPNKSKYTNKSRNYVFQETPPDTTTYLGLYSDGQYGVCLKLNENQYCYSSIQS